MKKILPILIGIIIATAGIYGAFQLFQNVFTRASNSAPVDVVVSEITENSAKVTWATNIETQGVITYGVSPTSLNFFAPETTSTISHSVDLTLLSPGSAYYFQIKIGDENFDNGGVPWTFSTKGAGEGAGELNPSLTPVSSVNIPDNEGATISGCNETDCDKIKAKMGNGCTASDYVKCLRGQ